MTEREFTDISVAVWCPSIATDKNLYSLLLSKIRRKKANVVYVWGDNNNKQLFVEEETKQVKIPRKLKAMEGRRIKQICGGYHHAIILTEDGEVITTGSQRDGEPDLILRGKNVIQVSSGGARHHMLALTESGQVYSWGENQNGELGHNDTMTRNVPTLIEKLLPYFITQIHAGGHSYGYSAAVTVNGEAYVWGNNTNGQLGLGNQDQKNCWFPRLLPIKDIKTIAVGGDHTIILQQDGTLWSCGSNMHNECGISGAPQRNFSPLKIDLKLEQGETIQKISANGYNTLMLTSKNNLYSWGFRQADVPTIIPAVVVGRETPERIIDICCGWFHFMCITDKNEVISLGSNDYGQLGTSMVSGLHEKQWYLVEKIDEERGHITKVFAGTFFCGCMIEL